MGSKKRAPKKTIDPRIRLNKTTLGIIMDLSCCDLQEEGIIKWLRKEREMFGGLSALDLIALGDADLVRAYTYPSSCDGEFHDESLYLPKKPKGKK